MGGGLDPGVFKRNFNAQGTSVYFNDVWASPDGRRWKQLTAEAPWCKRTSAAAAVLNAQVFVAWRKKVFVPRWTSDDVAVSWCFCVLQARLANMIVVMMYLYFLYIHIF